MTVKSRKYKSIEEVIAQKKRGKKWRRQTLSNKRQSDPDLAPLIHDMGCLTRYSHTDTRACRIHSVWLSWHRLFSHTKSPHANKLWETQLALIFSDLGHNEVAWDLTHNTNTPSHAHSHKHTHKYTLVSGRSALGAPWLFMSVNDKQGFYHLADRRLLLHLPSLSHTHSHTFSQ